MADHLTPKPRRVESNGPLIQKETGGEKNNATMEDRDQLNSEQISKEERPLEETQPPSSEGGCSSNQLQTEERVQTKYIYRNNLEPGQEDSDVERSKENFPSLGT
ncbi:unnamed protein product [Lepeophtheirus salmonis]|uniref:(salmon louse) hypothetical protein n=1 Tax=Lepeophtheirus salmonis TaxID=72036 RepID=A0A7R8H846_LEPSM|nr:unnamed protein product [Lepeophtheirus salmonis]CAF2923338.1 unnamed protein product [Lepeophtheirus salmonis]